MKNPNDDFIMLYGISTHSNPIDCVPSYNTGFYHLKHFEDHLSQFLNDIQIELEWYVIIMSKFLLIPDSTPLERYNLLTSMLLRYNFSLPN